MPDALCPLRLKKDCESAIRAGIPWIYRGDIIESSELLHIPPGSVVAIENHKGQFIGIGYFNAQSQIACRVLTLAREPIDAAFFKSRIEKALALRDKIIGAPYYRLIHSEADGLPGLSVDRFGDRLVAQVGTAGMERLRPVWLKAVQEALKPKTIIFRNDTTARTLEGLAQDVTVFPEREGDYIVEVEENGCIYYADLIRGQKTGWFYDQRDNRRMTAELAAGKTVLDVYAHSGGFGILAAKHGAAQVTLVDSSAVALALAQQAFVRNSVSNICDVIQGDAFAVMERLHKEDKSFDIVLADPPAFVKNKKDVAAGLKGYEKVARLAAQLVKPDGLLFVASCSHHAGRSAFNKSVQNGVLKAGRHAELLKQTGAAPDHPRHRHLPQSEYLKGILLHIR